MALPDRFRLGRSWQTFVQVLCLTAVVGCATQTSEETSAPPPEQAASTQAYDAFPRTPLPRIETGMHTGVIRHIDVDAAERYLVSGSEDKTVRVWDPRDGTLLQTLRIPIGAGDVGKVYSVALSPDGNTVAAGGQTGNRPDDHVIYLFDRASGEINGRITDLKSKVYDLAFSRNGHYLAAVLREAGLRVYDTSDKQLIAEDREYADRSTSVDFAGDGRLVTTSYDGHLRLYDRRFRRTWITKAPGGEQPYSASFSPDGRKIAVVYVDESGVDVVSAEHLNLLYSADTSFGYNEDYPFWSEIPLPSEHNFYAVAWSADGEFLYAGGRGNSGLWYMVRRWADGGRGAFVEYEVSKNMVLDLKPLRNGLLALATADPVLAVLSSDGSPRWTRANVLADYRFQRALKEFTISTEGDVVGFGLDTYWLGVLLRPEERRKRLARFSVSEMRLELNPKDDPTLHPAKEYGNESTGFLLIHERSLNGTPLPLEPGEWINTHSFAHRDERFLLGTNFKLRLFGRNGRGQWRERWKVTPAGTVYEVNIAPNGRMAVAAYSDGTIRWYRIEDGRELLALFPHKDGKRWVAWTPEGFFAASPGAKDLVGYHLNRGADRVAEFVAVDQLYDVFYRPDLLVRRIKGDEQAITEAVNRIGNVDEILAAGLPPEIELVGPEQENVRDPVYRHAFRVTDRGGGIGRIEYRIDGAVVGEETRGEELKRPGGVMMRPLELSPGKHVIEQTIYTSDDKVASRTVRRQVTYQAPKVERPRLYGLLVGIDAYRDSDLTLRYAANDARALKAALERQGEPLFDAVYLRLLTDDQATKEKIAAAFEDLAGKAKPTDVFVLYLSGHALVDEGAYYFLPQELIYRNQRALKDGSLSAEGIKDHLKGIQAGKTVVLLDTCYGGAFVDQDQMVMAFSTKGPEMKTAIDRLMRATGRAVLAASTSVQQAREGYKGHGVFTYALLEGLEGPADRPEPDTRELDGHVWIKELADYVETMVPKYSKEKWRREQFPMYDLKGQNFPIARTQ